MRNNYATGWLWLQGSRAVVATDTKRQCIISITRTNNWTNNNMYHITVKVRSSHQIGYHCGNKTIVRRKVRLWRKTDRCHDQSKPNFRPLKHKASKHQQPLYMCYVVFKDVVRFYLPWSALDGYHGHGVYSALDCLAGQTALKTVCWGQSSRKTS